MAPTDWDAIAWLQQHIDFQPTTSAAALYDTMESQSGFSLPVIYTPFDPHKRGHFIDRGQILDFATSTGLGRILDFGPGDGWPSLLLAPFVSEVVGVDGSQRRVVVCQENARRLGITNATFVHLPPGNPLPFIDGEFDGITASSSVEQTRDPKETLAELRRVLKPGGRLRMHYESLNYYTGTKEKELWLGDADGKTRIVIFDRHVQQEQVTHFGMIVNIRPETTREILGVRHNWATLECLTPTTLTELLCHVTIAFTWYTRHPSCRTLIGWLHEVGFSAAYATHDGGSFAGRLFDLLPMDQRPTSLEETDAYLQPLVATVIEQSAPAESQPGKWDHWVTAVK